MRSRKRASRWDFRFVDPKTWDGDGELVEDALSIAHAKEVYLDIGRVLDDDALTSTERARLRADYDAHSPTEARTLLVRVRVP